MTTNPIPQGMQSFGVSLRGPLHIQEQMPNQDAWLAVRSAFGSLIVVCDGLGSRPNSHVGAKSACVAVRDSSRHWAKSDHAPVTSLLRLIRSLWEVYVAPNNPEECATTCLFALALKSGRLIVAALGDGLALIRLPDGRIDQIIDRQKAFSNQTQALGTPHTLSDWSVRDYEFFPSGAATLLATDGIADDLNTDRLSEFTHWLLHEYGTMPQRVRQRQLSKALLNWPTPKHQDDKTLAVLWHVSGT